MCALLPTQKKRFSKEKKLRREEDSEEVTPGSAFSALEEVTLKRGTIPPAHRFAAEVVVFCSDRHRNLAQQPLTRRPCAVESDQAYWHFSWQCAELHEAERAEDSRNYILQWFREDLQELLYRFLMTVDN